MPYEGVGEISIYVHPDHKQHQIGSNLYKHLEEKARESGYWTIQAQLFTKNTPSKTFFEKHGFRQVGVREKIGKLDDIWIDNYLYEKTSTKAKIPIDLATLRDFLFYLLFYLAISFPIVFYKYTLVFVLVQENY